MANYNISTDQNFPFVSIITIHSDYKIDLTYEYFNITVKDLLEYYINGNDISEIENFYKKDVYPTIEICKYASCYEKLKCFECNGTKIITCPECKGEGVIYTNLTSTCPMCNGVGEISCPECNNYPIEEQGYAHTECDDKIIYSIIQKDTINYYNNSDYENLVKNGIQFWLDDDKKTLYIRIVAKGKSTSNSTGYILFNPLENNTYECGYVGFTIANFNITLNDKEKLIFNHSVIPKIKSNDPYPLEYNPPLNAWYEHDHIISGAIRTDYDWNDEVSDKTNKLFVNHNNPYSVEYEQLSGSNWETFGHVYSAHNEEPLYVIESSAFINDYLTSGITIDLYNSNENNSASRNLRLNDNMIKSYILNEYNEEKNNIQFDLNSATNLIENYHFVEYNNDYIYDDLYCYNIKQYISANNNKIIMNNVKLELEI